MDAYAIFGPDAVGWGSATTDQRCTSGTVGRTLTTVMTAEKTLYQVARFSGYVASYPGVSFGQEGCVFIGPECSGCWQTLGLWGLANLSLEVWDGNDVGSWAGMLAMELIAQWRRGLFPFASLFLRVIRGVNKQEAFEKTTEGGKASRSAAYQHV